jgi:hypothetical protein
MIDLSRGFAISSGLSGFLEKFGGGLGAHDVGPDLFGGEEIALRQGVFGKPSVWIAAGNPAQDHRGQVGGDGAGDADRRVGFVAVIGANLDTEAEAGIVLTLGANVLHGLQFGPIGAVTSALPSITLTISFELLMGMIRRGAVPAVVPLEVVAVPVSGTPEAEISPTVEKGYPQADSTTAEEAHIPAIPPASPAPMPVLTPAPDDLFPVAAERYADVLAAGQVPPLTKIKTELKVGQPRAAKIRTYLVQLAHS